MIKAIIFDFDGVILDTEIDRFLELKEEAKKRGYKLKENDKCILFGKRTNAFLKERFPNMPIDIIREISSKRKLSILSKAITLPLIPYIIELIKFLANRYTLAIATGSQFLVVERTLKKYDLFKYFKVVVTGEDFPSSKPNSECYKITLKRLNLGNSDVIIIEDSEAGISAAKKIECEVFALQNKFNKSQIKGADKIFKSHKEILKYFKSLN